MKNLLIIYSSLVVLFFSCNSPHDHQEKSGTEVLQLKGSKFDEDVMSIFGSWTANSLGVPLDSLRQRWLSDDEIKYRINDPVISNLNIQVPQREFGYLLESPIKDSIATYGPLYFRNVSVVTDMNKKPVAYQALAVYSTASKRDSLLKLVTDEMGPPQTQSVFSKDQGIMALEWNLQDRTIQIISFNANEFKPNSSTPENEYYQVDFLMIDNHQKDSLLNAHYYNFPDSIEVNGIPRNLNSEGLNKRELMVDDFTLCSDEEKENNKTKLKD